MTHTPDSTLIEHVTEVLSTHEPDSVAKALAIVLSAVMQVERHQALQAAPYERTETRQGYANGYKDKTISSRVGKITLKVPQVRGDLEFYPASIEKGIRSERALKLAMAEMYVNGVSTRRVSEIVEALCGTQVSASQVSRAAELLDEQIEAWRNRPLGPMEYLILDATYENVRMGHSVVCAAILTAVGISPEGQRRFLGVSVSVSEAEIHWREFLQSLLKRGLHGVKQTTSDDHAGVRAALMACLPGAAWQRCQFHLQQNAQKCVPKVSMRRAVAQDIRTVFNAPDRQEAERYLVLAVEKYREAAPALARWMQQNIPEGLSVFGRPASRRRLLRTTNMLERQMKEIKRRTRVAMIIPVHEVRVDEFIGAVDCAYPDTEGEFGVYLNTGYQQVSGSGQSEVMVAGIQERRYRFEDLPPINLVIVVDTSGSMREIDKLNSVKESLLVLLDTLRDKSYLSPVLFDAEPRVLLPYIRLGDSGPLSRLRGEVRKLAAGDLRNRRGITA